MTRAIRFAAEADPSEGWVRVPLLEVETEGIVAQAANDSGS